MFKALCRLLNDMKQQQEGGKKTKHDEAIFAEQKLAHVNATFSYSLELTNLSCGQNQGYKTHGAERSSVLKMNRCHFLHAQACVLLSS